MVDRSLTTASTIPCWIPAGTATVIGNLTITAGLFYCGTASDASRHNLTREPSFIRTDLPIVGGIPFAPRAGAGFAELAPSSRLEYVRWLAEGRPTAAQWLIDLFVCGIERRWMEEEGAIRDEELTHILEELRRLATYAGGASAASLRGLILAECRASGRLDSPLAESDPTFPNCDRGLTLAVLRECSEETVPLPPEWAVASLLHRMEPPRELEDLKRLIEARQLFAIRYRQAFGDGVTPRPTISDRHMYIRRSARETIQYDFYPAAESARLALDHCWQDLENIARKVLKEMGMYRQRVSAVVDLGERINRAGGLLPPELGRVHVDAVLARLQDRLRFEEVPLIIASTELASAWPTGGLGLMHFTVSNLAALLDIRGFRLEPHPASLPWSAPPTFFSVCRCNYSEDERWKELVLLQTVQQSRGRTQVTQQLADDLARPNVRSHHSDCLVQLLNRLPAHERVALKSTAASDPTLALAASHFLDSRSRSNDVLPPRSEAAGTNTAPPVTGTSTTNLAFEVHDDEVEAMLRRFQRDTMRRRQSHSA